VAARKKARSRSARSARRKKSSAKKPIQLGLVGCGGMGRYHLRYLMETPEIKVAALCDIAKTKMQHCVKEFFKPRQLEPAIYTDFEKMLSKTELDAVLLVTPHTVHYPHAKAALEAGLHVLSEKPMVTSSPEARELTTLAKRKKRLLGIAFQATMCGEFTYIRNLLKRGDLGRIELVDVNVAQRWKELSAGTWRQNPKLSGGGQFYDSGAHMMNSLIWLVDAPVKRVFALTDNCGTRVDINGSATVLFDNGVMASVACSGNSTIRGDATLTLYCEKGTIKTGIWGEKLEHWDINGDKVKYPYVPFETVLPAQNFAHAILGHDELRCPGSYGIILSELMDAIYESADTGWPVDITHRESPA
jgi:predicted dehydrogenase